MVTNRVVPLQEAERVKRERDLARMREEDEAREADRREDERRRREEEDRLQVTPTVRTCGERTLDWAIRWADSDHFII